MAEVAAVRVAFLGLGRMGAPMAAHVARAGHELTVWNRTPGRATDLVALGAREAANVADAVRDAEVVVTMLFGPDAVREVLGQVAEAVPAGGLVIDSSTVGPAVAHDLGKALRAKGIGFVDAPVAGSVQPAIDGTLGVLAGGSADDYATAEPLLRLWGDPARVRHLGPVGAGSAMKLVVNLTLGVAMGGVGEALRLAGDLGVDRTAALDVLAAGPLGTTVGTKRAMLDSGDFTPTGFSLDLMTKDLALALDAADGDLALTRAALAAAREATAAGHGSDDYAAIAGHIGYEGSADSI
ncbi:MAG: 3-hydroxyisobutyrate dehydrogenase [Frankiaceae bacterium]|jgi:3-hydroxyisobutyrate dehydrogenase|nr:3-hydroxyisobutyrate dehydrogenase [Frankiaceae bacterium]